WVRPGSALGCPRGTSPQAAFDYASTVRARGVAAEDTSLEWRSYSAAGRLFSSPRSGQEQRSTPLGILASRPRGFDPRPADHRTDDCALRSSRRLGVERREQPPSERRPRLRRPSAWGSAGVFPPRTNDLGWTRPQPL